MNRRQLFKGLAMAPAVPLVALVDEPNPKGPPSCEDLRVATEKALAEFDRRLHDERDWLAAAYERVRKLDCHSKFPCKACRAKLLLQGDGRWDPEKRRLKP